MLHNATPFPFVGSYALLIDTDQPPEHQQAELVRILKRDVHPAALGAVLMVVVSFPLRAGASGTKTVALEDLIDGTPLDGIEQRELADLQRDTRQRLRPNKAKVARREVLRQRAIWSPILARRLRDADAQRKAA